MIAMYAFIPYQGSTRKLQEGVRFGQFAKAVGEWPVFARSGRYR